MECQFSLNLLILSAVFCGNDLWTYCCAVNFGISLALCCLADANSHEQLHYFRELLITQDIAAGSGGGPLY